MTTAVQIAARSVANQRRLWIRILWGLLVTQLVTFTSFCILLMVGIVQVDNDRMVMFAFFETLQIILMPLVYMTASRHGIIDRRSTAFVMLIALFAFLFDTSSFVIRILNIVICPDDTRFQSADDCEELRAESIGLAVLVGILALLDICEFVVLAWAYASERAASALGPSVHRAIDDIEKRRDERAAMGSVSGGGGGTAHYSMLNDGRRTPFVNAIAMQRDLMNAALTPRQRTFIAVFKLVAWWDHFVTALYFVSWAISYVIVSQNNGLFLIGALSVVHAGYSVAMLWRTPIAYSQAAALLATILAAVMFVSDLINVILRIAALASCRSSATDPFIISLQDCGDSGVIAIQIVLVVLLGLFIINDVLFACIAGFLFNVFNVDLGIVPPTPGDGDDEEKGGGRASMSGGGGGGGPTTDAASMRGTPPRSSSSFARGSSPSYYAPTTGSQRTSSLLR